MRFTPAELTEIGQLFRSKLASLREQPHGILYPVIVDEAGRVLDGVHRARIAAELGIDAPVARHEGLDEERKLHLAVGLNMRRRHLDGDRRRDLVRKLHDDEHLSVRKIADVTGWSKSTVTSRRHRSRPRSPISATFATGSNASRTRSYATR